MPAYISEQLNFWQLLLKVKGIEIPIIQRDYAQGRKNQTKIRKGFLSSLRSAFDGENIELDFVYGSIEKGIFKPLDGQQRLTTLFLIHWYLSNKEKIVNDEIINNLKKFSYQTRISSRDFCKNLVTNKINFSNLIESDNDKNNSLSKTIKNSTWFFIAWQKDPTISAMLTMLDDIHYYFNQSENIWNKLVDTTNRILTFEFINLENFGLSDDLYIKMNARGKQLTEFENFKASFEKKITDNNWDNDKEITETFAHKADTQWTNLFWEISELNKLDFDNIYIKFISAIAINSLAIHRNENLKRDLIESRIESLSQNPKDLSPNDFEINAYNYLYNSLNIYSSLNLSEICYTIPFWHYLQEDNSFLNVIFRNNKPTYAQRVMFFAQTEYVLKNTNINQNSFSDWMRVCRNIVNNSKIENANNFISAINLISELSKGCSEIYEFISKTKINSQFANTQVKEEILKSKIILQNDDNRNAIFETEDTNLCKGKIEFALYCLDNPTEINFDYNKLLQIKNVFIQYLNDDDITNELRRCLLTIGNNDFYNYWGTWSHKTDTMKRCLIESTNDLKSNFIYGGWKHYLKELINLLVSKSSIEIIEQYVIPENMPKWKEKLIKEPIWLDEHCKVYYIMGIPNNDNSYCLLFNNWKKPNSRKDCKRIN
jgi:hypothetical protein